MKMIEINENGIYIVFQITKENQLKLVHFSAIGLKEENLCEEHFIKEAFQLVQVNFSGYNRPYEKHGNKHIVTAPGYLFTYVGMNEDRNEDGKLLLIYQKDEVTGAEVETKWQFYDGLPIIQMTNKVTNKSEQLQTLEYISSFCYTGIEKEGTKSSDDKMYLTIGHNGWQKEMNFKTYNFCDLGMGQSQNKVYQRTSKTIDITNTGNWSTKEYLPMAYIENREADTGLYFQIEHNGSWHFEIGDQNRHFYLAVSGPTEVQSHWFKNLQPGESFTSVPVSVGVCLNDFAKAMGDLTQYRRLIRRKNYDNEELPVIFNDYMNCLFGDPTTEKELPLIDAASACGCEYYVIDAGWYAKGEWWDSVGEWQESKERFPNGLKEVTDYIKKKGMKSGVWLELEVMGIFCDKAKQVPDDWFFMRHGKRVFDRSRYQLDFRNEAVRMHATQVIDRVVRDYGVSYIKMDYNIEPGIGTELNADSVGQGLLEHEKAYIEWLDGIFATYPELIIENCSSGGLRIDYALLKRYSIQSTSDQEDYRYYATIAANSPCALTPEQSAIWSYPLRDGDREETIYNMVNAMLMRIHQSGHLSEMKPENRKLVEEGIVCYKSIRKEIKQALPFWPLGLADNRDSWVSLGLVSDNRILLAVWRRGGKQNSKCLPVRSALPRDLREKLTGSHCVKQIYPLNEQVLFSYDAHRGELAVNFTYDTMARLFEISFS